MSALYPAFLKLEGRRVLLVGGGGVAAGKLPGLLAAGAAVTVIAPEVRAEIEEAPVRIEKRTFVPADLDGAFLAIAAAPPAVNHEVALAAEERGVLVNAVDDNDNASVYLGGVVRKGGVTLAISTDGKAPALAGLLREGLDAVLPEGLDAWLETAQGLRARWKAEGVPMSERRPLLLTALNQIYARRPRAPRPGGFVSLVGAGPGDPDLLTLKAARVLAEADVVYYDALVEPRVLDLAPQAHRFSVGKRCGRVAIAQETIHKLIIRAARQGKGVVRLKGGDPFVFGRGGEEALALAAAGIPFEVVPGVSNAVAAPALAGIPVTHRGTASAFVAVSGHAESTFRPVLSSLAPKSATVVVLMGLHNQVPVAETLRDAGWDVATPAAVIFGAGTDIQHVWRGTLAGLLAAPVDRPAGDPPGTLVIGDVVALSAAIAAVPPAGESADEDDNRRTNAGA